MAFKARRGPKDLKVIPVVRPGRKAPWDPRAPKVSRARKDPKVIRVVRPDLKDQKARKVPPVRKVLPVR